MSLLFPTTSPSRFSSDQLENLLYSPKAQAQSKISSKDSTHLVLHPRLPVKPPC